MNPDPQSSVVEDVTCLACGCLCDDIRVTVEAGRIVEADRACSIGRPWFLADPPVDQQTSSSIDGTPTDLDQAIDRATEILRSALAPVVSGLIGSTIETVASALAIAEQIGAVVDLGGGPSHDEALSAFQRVGQVSASLGEVKDRADLVVFWGVDPIRTHPRHWERYSVEPRGRFIPAGHAGRFVIVVDDEETQTSQAADLFFRINREQESEVLDVLRGLVKGVTLDAARASRSAGLPFSSLEGLAARLSSAKYGALFFDPSSQDRGDSVECLLRLVRDLNNGRRFVALEMGGPGNASGAASVMTWQTGAPTSVDYSLGYPRHLPGEAISRDRHRSDEVDAVLVVEDRVLAVSGVSQLVSFRVARPGISEGGTVARVDGVMLPLRAAFEIESSNRSRNPRSYPSKT